MRWQRREREKCHYLNNQWANLEPTYAAIHDASSRLGHADMKNVKAILRDLRGNPGVMTHERVLTFNGSDWSGGSDKYITVVTPLLQRERNSRPSISIVVKLDGRCVLWIVRKTAVARVC